MHLIIFPVVDNIQRFSGILPYMYIQLHTTPPLFTSQLFLYITKPRQINVNLTNALHLELNIYKGAKWY